MQWDDYYESQKDPFNKATDRDPVFLNFQNTTAQDLLQVKSDTVPLSVTVTYLKRARDVLRDVTTPANNINSELPIQTHEEIVNIAVRKMLATVRDNNYQVQTVEEQKTE